jgi:selenocysteine lyase/cysteine desulfurase
MRLSSRRGFLGGLCAAPLVACRRDAGLVVPREGAAVDFARLREQFVFPRDVGYLNTGTLGAMPRPVLDAFVRSTVALEERLPEFDYLPESPPPLTGYAEFTDVREPIATLVHADVDEIALTVNATMGMNFAAHGIRLGAGDEVVISNQEHPGGIGPWRLQAARRGIVVREVDVLKVRDDADGIVAAFADAIGPRTRALVICHLTSLLGLVLPVARLCKLARERGLVSVVDGAQTVGQMVVDVRALGCDLYVSSTHKWLCAPKGTGFLYVRREVQPEIEATLGSAEFGNAAWGAARLQQYGTGAVAMLDGLVAAIDFHEAIGTEAIEARDRALTARLRDGLARFDRVRIHSATRPELHAAVTTFSIDGVPGKDVQDAAWREKIRIRAVHEEYGCRVGTHYYVQDDEIDRLLSTVSTLVKR